MLHAVFQPPKQGSAGKKKLSKAEKEKLKAEEEERKALEEGKSKLSFHEKHLFRLHIAMCHSIK